MWNTRKGTYKTWEFVASFPDKKMRIAVIVFGMYEYPKWGGKFRGVVSRVKMDSEGVEL